MDNLLTKNKIFNIEMIGDSIVLKTTSETDFHLLIAESISFHKRFGLDIARNISVKLINLKNLLLNPLKRSSISVKLDYDLNDLYGNIKFSVENHFTHVYRIDLNKIEEEIDIQTQVLHKLWMDFIELHITSEFIQDLDEMINHIMKSIEYIKLEY